MSLLSVVNGRGLLSARPAAAAANEGYIYFSTDTSALSRSNGSSWDSYSGGGLADQGVVTYLDFTTAAAPSSPAAGKIRVYSKTGSHLAQKDSAGAETLLDATGSGGSGGLGEYASKYNPDHETPATAVAFQEEFNTATGMAWTAAPGIDDLASYPGFYRFKGTNTERHLSKAWVPGATDITVACKLSFAVSAPAATGAIGLYVGSATGNPADAVYCLLEPYSTGNMTFELYNENASSFALVGAAVVIEAAPAFRQQIYLRLTRVNAGPTWTAYASLDGRTWLAVATTGSKALTIGAFGIRTDSAHDYSIDWIRGWTSVVEKVGA